MPAGWALDDGDRTWYPVRVIIRVAPENVNTDGIANPMRGQP